MHGTYEQTDVRPTLRFERELDHPVHAVWRALTDPAELAQWFPTEVEMDLRPGGEMKFVFPEVVGEPPMTGEVLELDPPHRFAFAWGTDELRFDLQPSSDGSACVLNFTVVLDTRDKAARDAAGWHLCLDDLDGLLRGEKPQRPFPPQGWRERYEEYARRGLPTGAPVPED